VESKLNITACIVDTGFFVSIAEYLSQYYDKVLYYCPAESGYMKSDSERVGEGIGGVEKIYSFWDRIDEVDLFVFTDCYFADVQEYLKSIGKRVWGAGKTSWMELDRFRMREWQEKAGLPTPETIECIGIEDLKESLGENQFVKINKYRADMETAKHYDAVRSEQRFDDMKVKFGAYKDSMPFLVENKIEGVEVGYDGFSIDGKFPQSCIFGLEVKDRGYLGKATDYTNLPDAVKVVNDEVAKVFAEEKMRGAYSNEIRIDDKGNGYLIDQTMRCFSDDTEILTESGWKKFSDLDRTERVATLNPENYNIEYYRPYAYQEFDHSGEMVHIKSRKKTIDLLVTPDHSIWARKRNEGKLVQFRADDLRGRLTIPRTGNWIGEEREYFVLPEYHNEWDSGKHLSNHRTKHDPELRIKMESWLKFMGYYLSEGSCGAGNVAISQTKHKKKMLQDLQELPLMVLPSKKGIQISSMQLRMHMKQFGLCDKKFVPDYIKQLSPRLIKIFIEAYGLGDGSYRKGQWRIFTTSKQMANDLQELFLKISDVATISTGLRAGTKMRIGDGKEYTRNFDNYTVAQSTIRKDCYFEGHTRKRSGKFGGGAYAEKEQYAGRVYDLTVRNHIIYVRRNGVPCWSGNCPNPPYQLYMELWENFAEIIYEGAGGKLIEPKPRAKYGAIAIINSEFAVNHWLSLKIPKDVERWVKIMNMCKVDGDIYSIPLFHLSEIGAVVGIGDTAKEAIEKCKEHADQVEGDGVEIDTDTLDTALSTLKDAIEYGVAF
jgi:hypothetical protein